jgi:hypothetical protein
VAYNLEFALPKIWYVACEKESFTMSPNKNYNTRGNNVDKNLSKL